MLQEHIPSFWIIFVGSLSSNSSTSSLFLSLSLLFFFVARKAPSVALSHSFSIPPGQITQYWSPLISLLWGTVVVPPETLKPRVPQPPTSFSQQHLRSRLYQMFLDGLGQKSASNVRGAVSTKKQRVEVFFCLPCVSSAFLKFILRTIPQHLAESWSYTVKKVGVFFSPKSHVIQPGVPQLKDINGQVVVQFCFTPT